MSSNLINKTLYVVLGPTAVGKTALAIELAKKRQTEIISCDSRQFYKEMNIGTAVPSSKELKSITHHFIQHKSIHDTYNVGAFEQEALKKLKELFLEHQVVVMVGGSGLYIDAVCKGLSAFPEIDTSLRKELRENFKNRGIEWLQNEVKKEDPNYYQTVDVNNAHRLLRCLEVCRQTNQAFSSFRNKNKDTRFFNTQYIGLEMSRDDLYERINHRVDIMIQNGLLEEVKSLLPYQSLNALQTVGYRELFAFYRKEISLEEAIEQIKKNTRRYAKRQLTWFKKYDEAQWYKSAKEAVEKI